MAKKSKGRTKKFYEKNNLIDLEKVREEKRKSEGENQGSEEKLSYEEETEILEVDPKTSQVRPKVNRRRARKWRRFFIYLFVFVVLATMVSFSVHDIVKLKMEERELKKEQIRLLKQKKRLEGRVEKNQRAGLYRAAGEKAAANDPSRGDPIYSPHGGRAEEGKG